MQGLGEGAGRWEPGVGWGEGEGRGRGRGKNGWGGGRVKGGLAKAAPSKTRNRNCRDIVLDKLHRR